LKFQTPSFDGISVAAERYVYLLSLPHLSSFSSQNWRSLTASCRVPTSRGHKTFGTYEGKGCLGTGHEGPEGK